MGPSFLVEFFDLCPIRNNAPVLCRGVTAGFNASLEFLTGFAFLDGGNSGFIQKEAFPNGNVRGGIRTGLKGL